MHYLALTGILQIKDNLKGRNFDKFIYIEYILTLN